MTLAQTSRNKETSLNPEAYAALSDEDQQLKAEILRFGKMFHFFEGISDSDAAMKQSKQARQKWEVALVRRCAVLEQQRCLTQQKISRLEEKYDLLHDENEKLTLDLKRVRERYHQELGLKPKSMKAGKKWVADTTKSDLKVTSPRLKRGAPLGHKGNTRSIPEQIDVVEIIPLPPTCHCGGDLFPVAKHDNKYIEDILPVCRKVTHLKYQRGKCLKCGTVIRHPEAVKGPPVLMGPDLAAHLTVMRQMGVTYRKLSAFCTETLCIPLSPSGVLGIINRTSDQLKPFYTEIRNQVRNQNVLHGDETGWKVGQDNWYIWCFCNKILSYFHPDPRRAAKVAKNILGEDFKGTLVCDFYGAYNFVEKIQRCLIHLLRDIHHERKILPNSTSLENMEKRLMDLIQKGLLIQAMNDGPEKETEAHKLKKQLGRIAVMKVPRGKPTTLVKRIEKHSDDLLRFVMDPEIEYHNNRAERQIRPLVVSRKISFGSNTATGALRNCIIHSVMETCRLNSKRPVEFLKELLGGVSVPSLFENTT